MTSKELKIAFNEYSSPEEMDAVDQELINAAIEASKSSYAPYSHFNVGAAVRLEDGIIVKGSNQENAAYPSGICAERTAMFAAGATYPDKAMVSLAVVAGPDGTITDEPGTPCGACRQVMAQYQNKGGRNMSIILVGAKAIWKFEKVDDILPFIFNSLD